MFALQEIEAHKENLEAQLICWDQVVSGNEEVESWMNIMNTKLADSLTHFDDAVSVESCLMKYKVGDTDRLFQYSVKIKIIELSCSLFH